MIRRLTIPAILLALAACAWAEEPNEVAWTIQINIGRSDTGYDVAADDSGNAYVCGVIHGDLGGPNAGKSEAFLCKFDASGVESWAISVGSTGNDTFFSVAADGAGNVYVCGYTDGDLGGPNAGKDDAILIKFDSDGKQVWARSFGTSEDDSANDLAVDADGNVYVCGTTMGDLAAPTEGGADMFVGKISPDGETLWIEQMGTGLHERGHSIALDTNGNIYVGGRTRGDPDGENAGTRDVFLCKFDNAGTRLWTRPIGTDEHDDGADVAVDSDGNVYIAGTTKGDLAGENAGRADIFACKFSPDGDEIWATQFGGQTFERCWSIAVDGADNVYLCGEARGDDRGGSHEPGEEDRIFLCKLTADGSKAWGIRLERGAYAAANVAIDGLNNLFVCREHFDTDDLYRSIRLTKFHFWPGTSLPHQFTRW